MTKLLGASKFPSRFKKTFFNVVKWIKEFGNLQLGFLFIKYEITLAVGSFIVVTRKFTACSSMELLIYRRKFYCVVIRNYIVRQFHVGNFITW